MTVIIFMLHARLQAHFLRRANSRDTSRALGLCKHARSRSMHTHTCTRANRESSADRDSSRTTCCGLLWANVCLRCSVLYVTTITSARSEHDKSRCAIWWIFTPLTSRLAGKERLLVVLRLVESPSRAVWPRRCDKVWIRLISLVWHIWEFYKEYIYIYSYTNILNYLHLYTSCHDKELKTAKVLFSFF